MKVEAELSSAVELQIMALEREIAMLEERLLLLEHRLGDHEFWHNADYEAAKTVMRDEMTNAIKRGR